MRRISATHLFSPNKRIAALGEFIRDIGLKMVSEIKSLAERNGEVLEIRKVLHFGSLDNVMKRVFGRSYEFGDESKVGVCELEGLVSERYELLGIFNWSDHFSYFGLARFARS